MPLANPETTPSQSHPTITLSEKVLTRVNLPANSPYLDQLFTLNFQDSQKITTPAVLDMDTGYPPHLAFGFDNPTIPPTGNDALSQPIRFIAMSLGGYQQRDISLQLDQPVTIQPFELTQNQKLARATQGHRAISGDHAVLLVFTSSQPPTLEQVLSHIKFEPITQQHQTTPIQPQNPNSLPTPTRPLTTTDQALITQINQAPYEASIFSSSLDRAAPITSVLKNDNIHPTVKVTAYAKLVEIAVNSLNESDRRQITTNILQHTPQIITHFTPKDVTKLMSPPQTSGVFDNNHDQLQTHLAIIDSIITNLSSHPQSNTLKTPILQQLTQYSRSDYDDINQLAIQTTTKLSTI